MSMFDGKNVTESIVRWALLTPHTCTSVTECVSALSGIFTSCKIPVTTLKCVPKMNDNCFSTDRFYHTNYVRRFMLKRPFHRGQKDKSNEYKVCSYMCSRVAY